MNRATLPCVILGLSIITAAAIHAGPLTPPAGPVASTYKTLSEVEPRIVINAVNTPGDANSIYRIAQRGSYYLDGNLTGVAGKSGIEIGASGVTIDLNGFDLLGVPGSLQGVVIGSGTFLRNIEVRNGSIRDWGGAGVQMFDPVSFNSVAPCRIANLRMHNNGGFGLIGGNLGSVEACHAFQNAGGGLGPGPGCVVVGCTSNNNTGDGFTFGGECTISGCTAQDNTGDGITAVNGRITITGCTVVRSGDDGIVVTEGSTISNCTVLLNSNDGIQAGTSTYIYGNTCHRNGLSTPDGAGIHLLGQENRVEDNNCTQQDFGIKVDGTGSLIIRNSANTNTTDFGIAAGNTVGTVVATEAAMNAAANANVNIAF